MDIRVSKLLCLSWRRNRPWKPKDQQKKTPAASKKQRKARAKLTREIKLEIAKAYMERGDKTAAEIAAKYGVSQYTVYKLAKTEVNKLDLSLGNYKLGKQRLHFRRHPERVPLFLPGNRTW